MNMNDPSKKPILAYKGDGVGVMCRGKGNTIYTASYHKVLVVKYENIEFTVKRTISVKLDFQPTHMCHIPSSDVLILNSTPSMEGQLCALSIEGEVLWKISQTGVKRLTGMVYVPDLDRLLVAERANQRILVISPNNGRIAETLPFYCTWIQNLHLIDDRLLVQSGYSHVRLSYYAVSSDFRHI